MTKITMDTKIKGLTIQELINKNSMGLVNGQYVLLQEAYCDNNRQQESAYFADAVKIGDEITDGEAPLYLIEFKIIDTETQDGNFACDWTVTGDITKYSTIDIDQERLYYENL